jgi:hypothetical protein
VFADWQQILAAALRREGIAMCRAARNAQPLAHSQDVVCNDATSQIASSPPSDRIKPF